MDSGYAGEEEEYLASQRAALDSARQAQINRLRGARRQDLKKGFTLEELMQDDDGEPFDPNEVRAINLLFSRKHPALTSITATVFPIFGHHNLHLRLRRRRSPYQSILQFSLVEPRSPRPRVLRRLYPEASSHRSLQHSYIPCLTYRQHSSPQQASEEEDS